jgi:hypothetical protein
MVSAPGFLRGYMENEEWDLTEIKMARLSAESVAKEVGAHFKEMAFNLYMRAFRDGLSQGKTQFMRDRIKSGELGEE